MCDTRIRTVSFQNWNWSELKRSISIQIRVTDFTPFIVIHSLPPSTYNGHMTQLMAVRTYEVCAILHMLAHTSVQVKRQQKQSLEISSPWQDRHCPSAPDPLATLIRRFLIPNTTSGSGQDTPDIYCYHSTSLPTETCCPWAKSDASGDQTDTPIPVRCRQIQTFRAQRRLPHLDCPIPAVTAAIPVPKSPHDTLSAFLTAVTTSAAVGREASSRLLAYGIGRSAPHRRVTG